MNIRGILWLAMLSCVFGCLSSHDDTISFNKDIRPILNKKCLRCHGGVKANGGLSLLFEADAFAPTESSKPAIVRGNHTKSEFYLRLIHDDPEYRMPYEEDALTKGEIDLIAKWIDQGATWQKHWAYLAPKTNIIPPTSGQEWAINDIDPFIAEQHQAHGLTPQSQADKPQLLRRVYLDLIGLPPSPEEALRFLTDDRADAYERLVDDLLASPHFGERWAAMWLDLARYADTKGYEKDSNRSIWLYRDWVIKAFNQDLPFDSFTIYQLAGDLLPHPSQDQLVATAFHRNAMSNDEGGTDDEEFRVASVIERVATTYEVWQATTMACVQCHSHPYDPFKQEDFYTSMAFFNNTADKDIYNEQPKLYTYSPARAAQVSKVIDWVKQRIPEVEMSSTKPLYEQIDQMLDVLDYRVTEAEDFDECSPLIELIWPDLDMVWQVQDSAWIRFEEVDLTEVAQIGFRTATMLNDAGSISIHLDSLQGEKIGEVEIYQTGNWEGWQWSRPTETHLFHEYKTSIRPIQGTHDLYFRFGVGDTYVQHLFYLDKIIYHERSPRYREYGPTMAKKLNTLSNIPTFTTPIYSELPSHKARTTNFLNRGSWLQPEHEVQPATPAIYAVSQEDIPTDRLSFARWLVSDQNPLTARVMVNRLWEQFFGHGLVESMEEFGSQGAEPTHPALLDWLATRLMHTHQWHLKPMIKEMVMSATYRQASSASPSVIEHDPRNQWLARGARIRLSSEQIRDQILAVSGLLNCKIGGPSVIIPQLNIAESKIPFYAITGDSAMHRRTLYTFWKRTDPFPSVITFDSPDRTTCSSRRIRTNTPLQALNLLNNETYYEASKAMAAQMLQVSTDLEEQIRSGYRSLLYKELADEDLRDLVDLYLESKTYYEEKPSPDSEVTGDIDMAAMTLVANALLNLDAFIVKA